MIEKNLKEHFRFYRQWVRNQAMMTFSPPAVSSFSEVCSDSWKYFFPPFSPAKFELKWKYNFIHRVLNRLLSKIILPPSEKRWGYIKFILLGGFYLISFFFLTTAGILRSSVAGRKLKIGDSRWQVCSELVPFFFFFWRKATFKNKREKNTQSYVHKALTDSTQRAQLHWLLTWQPQHQSLPNSLLTNCPPATLCMLVPGGNSLVQLHIKLNRYLFSMELRLRTLLNALQKA